MDANPSTEQQSATTSKSSAQQQSESEAGASPETEFIYERPWMYDKQRDAFFNTSRYSLTEASTKAGKTVAGIAWLFEQAYMAAKPGQNFWWVAPVYPQAEIAFYRMKRAIPAVLIDNAKMSDLSILLTNGSIMKFKSGEKPDNLYGEDVYAAVVDEASRLRAEAWHALRSTVTATRGPIRFIGNVKGRRNWFYELCRRAEGGAADMEYHKIIAADAVAAGVLDAEEIEGARAELPENVFRELYLAEPSDDGGNPFGLDAIQRCLIPKLSPGLPVVYGWDLAKSVDWTVGIGLDKNSNVCRFFRWQRVPWKDTVARIHEATLNKPALVDSTGVGDPILEYLQEKPGSKYEGYNFNPLSKQKLMEGLALKIQSQAVHFPDGQLRRELEDFEYEYTRTGVRYSAPEGFHDDCVMALALACMHEMHAPTPIKVTAGVLQKARVPKFGVGGVRIVRARLT